MEQYPLLKTGLLPQLKFSGSIPHKRRRFPRKEALLLFNNTTPPASPLPLPTGHGRMALEREKEECL